MTLGRLQAAVYAAEDACVASEGRVFSSFTEAWEWLEPILTDLDLPDLDLHPSPNGWSACDEGSQTLYLALPTDARTILHEVAHLLTPAHVGHGLEFVERYLSLVRDYIGFFESAALRRELVRQSPEFQEVN